MYKCRTFIQLLLVMLLMSCEIQTRVETVEIEVETSSQNRLNYQEGDGITLIKPENAEKAFKVPSPEGIKKAVK